MDCLNKTQEPSILQIIVQKVTIWAEQYLYDNILLLTQPSPVIFRIYTT